MLYRPDILWIRAYRGPFTFMRWIRLPHVFYLSFMGGYPNVLRDPTPNPFLSDDDLKPGFYFKEYVH